jgi:hypothetical protein
MNVPPYHEAEKKENLTFSNILIYYKPVTVAERSKACTAFARSEAGIVSSSPTQGMDVWYVYAFILCLCCPL